MFVWGTSSHGLMRKWAYLTCNVVRIILWGIPPKSDYSICVNYVMSYSHIYQNIDYTNYDLLMM